MSLIPTMSHIRAISQLFTVKLFEIFFAAFDLHVERSKHWITNMTSGSSYSTLFVLRIENYDLCVSHKCDCKF